MDHESTLFATSPNSAGRNLVICCDGTSNQFGPQNTNVVRLAQVLDRDPYKQLLYYDPGVGTLPEPGIFSKIGAKLSLIGEMAFGWGLTRNVEEAYSFLMNYWMPGDKVFLFGFSRGAYTVRVLAGLLHALGLLPRGNDNLVPYVMRLFAAVRNEKDSSGVSGYWKLCNEFRWSFARLAHAGDRERRFPVHFLGLWDTVSSVGWVWDPVRYPFTAKNPGAATIRHAVSIDERRWFFRQNLMEKSGDFQDLQQLWFPGVHADVGGGYPESEGGLWRVPFGWILEEARQAGLQVDRKRLDHVLSRTEPSPTPWNDQKHESLKWYWWPAEFAPKLTSRKGSNVRLPRIGLGARRFVKSDALIHKSALLRIREIDYAPANLSSDFFKKVRALADVPEQLALGP